MKDTEIPLWDAQLGIVGGNKVHNALTKKYEGTGKYLEKDQVVSLTDSTDAFSSIQGMITATPDMYWVGGSTLYIEPAPQTLSQGGVEDYYFKSMNRPEGKM